jgi:hypothetical protein
LPSPKKSPTAGDANPSGAEFHYLQVVRSFIGIADVRMLAYYTRGADTTSLLAPLLYPAWCLLSHFSPTPYPLFLLSPAPNRPQVFRRIPRA